ncbi:MAG: GspE/PulE family protein [Syntrophales bacterium]
MDRKKRLGDMLVESNLLTKEQLTEALVKRKETDVNSVPLKLGQYLSREGIVSENQIVDMLSRQLKIARYHPDLYPINVDLGRLLPTEIAQKFKVAPLRRKGRLLTIAMTDPLDINTLDTIEITANAEVEPVVCTDREVSQLINGIYGMQSGVTDVLESMDIQAQAETDKAADQATEEVRVTSLQEMAGEAPVIRLVNSIFAQAIREGASDVHISPQNNNLQVRFRIDGKLHEVPSPPKSLFLPIVARMKILANMDITISRIPQDGRFTLRLEKREINVRVSSMPTIYGENVVLRLLDMSVGVYSLDSLGMIKEDRDKITAMIGKAYGMVLSTGPTGSGKSTSLYAILNELNRPDTNIITIEDPVEYRIDNIRQVQLNLKAGMTFASGLRSVLRQDPDIIMVGEIRDAETAAISIQAAQTGHRLLSTLHTNDAAGAITRFMDMGIEPFLVSSALLVSFGQRLVRTVCPYCKESYRPPESALIAWGLDKAENANFQRGKGCYQCMNTGYKGRMGIFEVLVNDQAIQEMILQRKPSQEITRLAVAAGKLRTLKVDAAAKVLQGITTLEEAASAVMV